MEMNRVVEAVLSGFLVGVGIIIVILCLKMLFDLVRIYNDE